MSLVKFTELPSGSIQGGDVLAVAGTSSYKVTATELANFANARVQGGTTSTVAYVETKAIANKGTIDTVILPQLGQVGTNKGDIATLKTDLVNTDAYGKVTRGMIHGTSSSQYDNQPALIAGLIKYDNFIKNPAAQHISLYWKDQTGIDASAPMLADLQTRNLEYPGWSRTGDLLTYNFTVALDGQLTIGQLGGNNAENLEYRVNGGAWDRVGNGGIRSIGVGYVASTAGAQISVRMKKDSGGIAFAIPSPAYWTTDTGVRDPNIRLALEKLTYGLRRKRIDLEACGYWFNAIGNNSNSDIVFTKPPTIGFLANATRWEYEKVSLPKIATVNWGSDLRITVRVADNSWNDAFIFASTDPNLYTQAEVFI